MSRPVKVRRICSMPQVREFIPRPNACEGHIQMSIDEYEVIRLIDNLGYSQKECSEQMCVARTTVQAIYDAARRKIADAIVNGRRLVIAGGNYAVLSLIHIWWRRRENLPKDSGKVRPYICQYCGRRNNSPCFKSRQYSCASRQALCAL